MKRSFYLLCALISINASAQCFEKVYNGYFHYVAISQDGTLWAWGENGNGQLGDGSTTDKDTPVQISAETDWVFVSAGENHNLAIKEDGTLWGWGYNNKGKLGSNAQGNFVLSPIQINSDNDWSDASAGAYASIAIKSNGTLWAWGSNQYGFLGNGAESTYSTNIPEKIGTETSWTSVAGRHRHCIAINDGTLWAWGYNAYGQLGTGTTGADVYTPTQIGTATNWKWIENGEDFSYALKENNTLWAWGDGGSLGIDTAQPVQVGTHSDWKSVSIDAGYFTRKAALLIKQNGTLWAWGSDTDERLGNGPQQGSYEVPTQIGTATDWENATIGYYESNAVKSDGTFWAWGDTELVGNGSSDIPTPMQYDCTPLMSVNDLDVKGLDIYPNPAKDVVNFSHKVDAELFDTAGRKVMTVKNTSTVNVSTLPKGVYMVVTTDGITKNLIIK